MPDDSLMTDFDFDRFLSIPRVSALRAFADGSRLVVSVAGPAPDGKGMRSSLWSVDPEGKRPARRLTRSAPGESIGRFTRDGSILFSSKRVDPEMGEEDHGEKERSGLWLLPAEGGEPELLVNPVGGVDDAVAARGADAVVFAPLNKQAIIRGGHRVRDEYELIASFVNAVDHDEVNVIPHPAGEGLLWVARATSHVPLREVPELLTLDRIVRTIKLAHGVAKAGGTRSPRIGVAALNPHAGEEGAVGDEEGRVIRPAIEASVSQGIDATGPHPPDHVFRLARAGRFDAVVAMYHDQAQIATKLLGFDRGVSVGIGYPFITVTPSHGTAFDIAGKGLADPQPMIQALALADQLVRSGFNPRLR